ncbi:MAG TPA: hypothetical protein VGH20_08445, partial [Myxococcales bacterium]
SFGFEASHRDISMKIGERKLLPKVREASEQTLVVSDGFSCREQIETTGRTPMHLSQVLQRALRQSRGVPERSLVADARLRARRLVRRGAFVVAACAAVYVVARRAA